MRRQLALGAAAVTVTVVVAFLLPLALAVRTLASDRALNDAEQAAQALAAVLAVIDETRDRRAALRSAQAVTDASLAIYYPGGRMLGDAGPADADVTRAFDGAAFVAPTSGGQAVLVPVVRPTGTAAVIRAFVPQAVLARGVGRAWTLLGLLGVALIAIAVFAADWLGRAVVQPVRDAAVTARRLGAGELEARVVPAGPREVADVGVALNGLAGRITELLAAERELIADLSHRLRTPLTALRLDAEAITDPPEAAVRIHDDVDAVESAVTRLIHTARGASAAPDVVDLTDVLRERAAFWGALAEEQGRDWALDVDGAPPLTLPRDDAETLIDVLLDNVFAHTPDGTAYRIELGGHGQRVRLVVEDAGPGLAVGVPTRGRSGGGSTGLGLDIARGIAERCGGGLHVRLGRDGGARVEVTLRRGDTAP